MSFLPSADVDPTVIYKAFDYLSQVVEAKIQKATGSEKNSLQELKDNIIVAKETYYKANQKVIDLTVSTLVKFASQSIDLRAQEDSDQLAQAVFSVIKDLKPTDIRMNSANLIKLTEKLAPDSKETTVDGGFDALLKLFSKKLVDHTSGITESDRKDLRNQRDCVNKAKIEFAKTHEKELKKAVDMTKSLKEVLMRIREVVYSEESVQDMRKQHEDPEKLIKYVDDKLKVIGSLIKHLGIDDPLNKVEMSHLMGGKSNCQAAKRPPLLARDQVAVKEMYLVKAGVLD